MQGFNTQELNFSISTHVSRWENQIYYEIIDLDFYGNFSNME